MQSFAALPVLVALVGFSALPVAHTNEGEGARRVASTSTPILEQFDDSLTTYLPGGPSSGQDLSPQVGHRGTNLEGTFRALPSQRMTIQGNPFERAWRESRISGLRLSLGGPEVQDVDIALPAEGFSWVVGRSYNAQQQSGSHRDSNGYQGKNWFQDSQPEIQLYTHATDANKDVVYLYYGADRFAEYQRVDVTPGPSDEFKGTNGAAGVFSYSAGSGGEPDTYTLTDQGGNEIVFFGFDANAGAAAGQIWKITDPASNTAYVGDATTASTAITNGYDTNGHIVTAYDTSGRRYTYTYTLLDGVDRLTRVLAEAGPTTWTTVAQVDYGYYSTSESYGEPGDLKLVTISTPMTDSGITQTRRKYYRYWEGTYNASSNPGHVHALKYIVDAEGTRAQDYEDSTFDQDFLALSDAALAPYSSAYYEYDSNHRVDLAWFNGECGCSGGVNGTHEFRYETNSSYSDTTGYQSGWAARTVVKRPDASYLTQYYDETWQPLSRVITDDDPANTSPAPNVWAWKATRGNNAAISEVGMPSSASSYTHSTGAIKQKNYKGLLYSYKRATTGAMTGFATKRRFKKGRLATSLYYEAEWAWTQANLLVGDEYVVRPILDKQHEYQVQGTGTGNRITTDYTTVVSSGGLDLVSVQTTDPIIPTSQNGSGVATGETVYFRSDGTTSFRKARDGVISYVEYTDNQVTKRIEDVDTTQTSDFDVSVPSGLTSASGALHRVTTIAYDAQGRVSTTTEPDGRVLASYYSRLADERGVFLSYADYETSPSTKYFGPVSYVVTNHAGKSDVNATVALTSNESSLAQTSHVDETDADPITAMDLGSVVRLSTSRYNETGGYLLESRLYFDVPASGEGTDGTNYDATFIGYDDLGRRQRVKDPTGTIHRTSYTIHNEVVSRWIGTNDSSFNGGEASGTDNMVKTETLIYDANVDGGDRYVTKRKVFVEDGTTGQRITTYKYDLRGRLLLETRPTAPHAFYGYDNQGRVTATGLFSSTASINTNTDAPTTETANRMALSESAYDKMGQLWKTTRHNIDPADGSDDDNVTSQLWRDEEGRVIMKQGETLAKSTYDSLGRQTHRFTLAKVDDTAYADADDVTGDHVLEESQTVYDDLTDEVLLSVVIQRDHDDWGAGETTGALDANADGDALKVTASDLKGRAQINATWYDRFYRPTDQVAYGTFGGATFDRTGLSVPARSDTALRTSYAYDTAGELQDTTDPRALIARTVYDDAGRETKVIRNYQDGTPSGTDSDQTVRYEYTDGLRTKIVADMPAGTADQTTIYTYGTTKGATAGDSKIATGNLLYTVQYPDSSGGTDVVTSAYNAQGEQIWLKDQAGNVTETDYDTMGRQTHRRLTTIDVDFDSTVARISRTYDSLGRADRVTQYDSATVGSGSVIDEVQYGYDGWGNMTRFDQDRDSTVGGASGVSEYTVSYTFAKATGGRQTVRRSTMTLPSANVITFDYTADQDDAASRVSKLVDGATTLARYRYLGARWVVGTDYEEPGIYSHLYDATSYANIDRFNRTTKSSWTSDLATPVHFYNVDIAYDRNSNITRTEDNVHTGFDVAYTMDNLDRLTDAQEGTWNGTSITSETREQEWTLSHTGNWDLGKLDLNGDGDWSDPDEYQDSRTHNDVNELTARDTDNNGTNDYTLSYDEVGNLIDDGENYKYVYDPLGRMRKITTRTGALVAEYLYNGLGFQIARHEDTDDDGDVDASDRWYYTAFDEAWRVVATYRESDTSPKEEFVVALAGPNGLGGSSYINDVVCRNKDTTTDWVTASDGTFEERYHLCPNWRGDVSAMVSDGRTMIEWDKYSAYGVPFGLPLGDADSDGDADVGDTADTDQIQAWIDAAAYDVRGDIDLDGDVDASDKASVDVGVALGRDVLSGRRRRKGYGGYEYMMGSTRDFYLARRRVFACWKGGWITRDPVGYWDGMSLIEGFTSNPVANRDPRGNTNCTLPLPGSAGAGSSVTPIPSSGPMMNKGKTYKLHVEGNQGPNRACCDKVKKAYGNAGKKLPGAQVICCNGVLTACNWLGAARVRYGLHQYAPGYNPLLVSWLVAEMDYCITGEENGKNGAEDGHESIHIKDIKAAGGGCGYLVGYAAPSWADFGFGRQAANLMEIKGYKREFQCMDDIPCGSSPDPDACRFYIQERETWLKENSLRQAAQGFLSSSSFLPGVR